MTQVKHSSRWRVWHRWLSLVFGVQMVLWSISGAYMVFFDIDYIHGDHLIQDISTPITTTGSIASVDAVLAKYPHTQTLELETRWLNNQATPVYHLQGHQGEAVIDAASLAPIAFSQQDIEALAVRYYALDDPKIASTVYLTDEAPSELNPKLLPIWQVNFDDFGSTSLYLSEVSGELLVKRHTFWRGFDIFWMIHIMDYKDRVDIETWWLQGFIIGTFLLMITGVVLLFFTISFKRKPKQGDSA
ncbi:hypothetical protein NOG12_12620 [Pseudidiomarina sp. GXY010]|uniref:PepSY domain-containing protein n=1 Tax=Pseudidiomarina fusca TaxID=2965078 RepID=A0ABU3KZI4_9GAMM|nr:hypothetical protein [Pseudidiomarina sp. GXY010]MDT7526914.1 hypothetical protein [Pseudidiomarina sp. GXY010]